MLDAEADRLCRAERHERTEARKDTRAGSYQRQLQTKAGEVTLKVPKLRTLPFETAIIERYRRRESSVEEALVEMYLAGVSVRRVEDITEALWGVPHCIIQIQSHKPAKQNVVVQAVGIVIGTVMMRSSNAQENIKTGLRLNHVGIAVKDYQGTVDFYTKVMRSRKAFGG